MKFSNATISIKVCIADVIILTFSGIYGSVQIFACGEFRRKKWRILVPLRMVEQVLLGVDRAIHLAWSVVR
jgi:hypothetical protein